MVDIIQKKRDGNALTAQEIEFAISGYTEGTIPDYQMSALAMAIYFQGMNDEEIANLTMFMVNSGDVVDLSPIAGIKVDKHSTGGVGDKTSLIVVPLVATVGVPVAKMSGRGLGHTGGTVDKLESIEGFKIELSKEEFFKNVNENKMSLVGQSGNLAPADKKLYALRDVTATVNSLPLIASSIMSKKIASGADAIVLDVKIGSGAFMKTVEDAQKLAEVMVQIGKNLNRKTIAVLSDMNQPLGFEVGNALEIKEVIEVLQGRGEKQLTELCLTLASQMCVAGGIYSDVQVANDNLRTVLKSGKALETFVKFVEAQGGNPEVIRQPELLPDAKYHIEVQSDVEGYISSINAEAVGIAAMLLGAGRKTKEEAIDYSVGISMKKKIGDYVTKGEVIGVIHSNNHNNVEESVRMLLRAFETKKEAVKARPIVYEIIS